MNKRQRKMLNRVMGCVNKLGGSLDLTATSINKLIDRSAAHRHVCRVLLAVLADNPTNDTRNEDYLEAEQSLLHLEKLITKDYSKNQKAW